MQKEENKKESEKEFKIRLYNYILQLLKFLSKLPNDPVNAEVKRQLIASGTSIGANYFEARGASSKRDYQNFFSISLKSSNESCFWLALLRDGIMLSQDLKIECKNLLKETEEIAKIFASSILTMKGEKKCF